MSYRILCDEHVEPQTVRYLERSGHTAAHVRDELSLGVDDEAVAEHAVDRDFVLLTNDRGFLDQSRYPNLTVLCYTDNEAEAYELSAMIEDVTTYYPTQEELPAAVFLP